jgi:hypothetical protein
MDFDEEQDRVVAMTVARPVERSGGRECSGGTSRKPPMLSELPLSDAVVIWRWFFLLEVWYKRGATLLVSVSEVGLRELETYFCHTVNDTFGLLCAFA